MHTKKLVYVITYHLSFEWKKSCVSDPFGPILGRDDKKLEWSYVEKEGWELLNEKFGIRTLKGMERSVQYDVEKSKFNTWTAYKMHYSENDNSLI